MFNIKLTLLKNKAYADGRYPIMIRVARSGSQKKTYLSTGKTAHPNEFDSKLNRFRKTYPDHHRATKEINDDLNKAFELAESLIKANKYATIKEFKDRFHSGDFKFEYNLFEYIEKRIKEIENENTRRGYITLYHAVKTFSPNKSRFEDWSPESLENFAAWLKREGLNLPNKSNTVLSKLRILRAVYNHARKNNYCPKSVYPFEHFSVGKFQEETIKRALTVDQIKLIKNFDTTETPELIHAKYFFLFSYYARGMNPKDIAALKWSDIKDNEIHYFRAKTGKLFKIGILPYVKEILQFYKAFVLTDYVFPVYSEKEKDEHKRGRAFFRYRTRVQKGLDEITSAVGINENVTMYWARHSFATHLTLKNISIVKISQLLGHASIKTTQIYIKGLSSKELNDVVLNALE